MISLSDAIAIATFAIAILGIVYAFGQRDAKLSELERNLNNIGTKLSNNIDSFSNANQKLDNRIDELSKFYVRVDSRVRQLQDECFGEERTNRLRETNPDAHYTTLNENWYSENSGIDM